MRKFCVAISVLVLTFAFVGCGNLSPRLDPDVENHGEIDEIKNNQNGIMGEIGTLKNQSEIHGTQIEKLQQGMVNLQSNFENSGVQVLSGPGGITVAVVAIVGLAVVLMYYRSLALKSQKTADILAKRIVDVDDPVLEDAVFQAAMYSDVEENVLKVMKKHKS